MTLETAKIDTSTEIDGSEVLTTNVDNKMYMLQGNNLQKVKVFKPGELILRITAKRARLMLVLGPNIDNMTALLEVTNGTHKDYTSSSYYAQNYISHIVSAFKRKQPELANLEYYDTGFNVYDRFKDSIKRELNYNIADEFSF